MAFIAAGTRGQIGLAKSPSGAGRTNVQATQPIVVRHRSQQPTAPRATGWHAPSRSAPWHRKAVLRWLRNTDVSGLLAAGHAALGSTEDAAQAVAMARSRSPLPTSTRHVAPIHSKLSSGYGRHARSHGTRREYESPRVRLEPREALTRAYSEAALTPPPRPILRWSQPRWTA